MDDLESNSSDSSEGYHFEITEARKQTKNQDSNRTAFIGIQDPHIQNPSNELDSLEKGKVLGMKI